MESALQVRRQDVNERVRRLQAGMALRDVRAALGGDEFNSEQRGGTTARWWRFAIVDAEMKANAVEIYQADFEGDRFVAGTILPQG